MGFAERCKDADYKNWIKCGLSLMEVKKVLEQLTELEISRFHPELKKANKIASPCTSPNCMASNIEFYEVPQGTYAWRLKPQGCPNGICDKLLVAIVNEHMSNDPQWIYLKDNCDIKLWATRPWEIAKSYMGKIGKNKHSKILNAQTTDVDGLLTLMRNCKRFCMKCKSCCKPKQFCMLCKGYCKPAECRH